MVVHLVPECLRKSNSCPQNSKALSVTARTSETGDLYIKLYNYGNGPGIAHFYHFMSSQGLLAASTLNRQQTQTTATSPPRQHTIPERLSNLIC